MKALHYLFIASFIVYAYMAAVVLPAASARIAAIAANPECAKPLDLFIGGFSGQEVYASFGCMGQKGLQVYRDIETFEDVFYPISYALFLGLGIFIWAGYCLQKKKWRNLLALLPLLAMLFDYAENASIISLIDQFPKLGLEGISVQTASFFNQAKWALAFLSMALFAFFGIWALIKRLSQKRKVA
jgi:hypothetical protein